MSILEQLKPYEILCEKTSEVEIEHPHGTFQLVWDNGLFVIGLGTRNRRKHMKS